MERTTYKKRHFDRELEALKRRLLRMGGLVEDLFVRSLEALRSRDAGMVEEAHRIEEETDQEEVVIEEECLKLIALYQPVAVDLRFIASVLKINAELERIGDLAVHLAERAVDLAQVPQLGLPEELHQMGRAVQAMVRDSLQSLVNQDSDLARKVLEADDAVDDLHRAMFEFVAEGIRNHPELAQSYLQLLSASRYLERTADSATNIAEDVYYLVEGTIIRHQPESD